MRTVVALVASALAVAGCRACPPAGDPTVELGTGERRFEALDDEDPVFSLVYGPQGGWHVPLGFRAQGFDLSGLGVVTVDGVGTIDGEVVATLDGAWATFTCDRGSGDQLAWNTLLIFEVPDPAPLHRAALSVAVTLEDQRRVTAEASVDATILDPTRSD
jgi:hypothetical protein